MDNKKKLGRPSTGRKAKRVYFSMRPEFVDMISEIAEKNLTTVSEEVRRLIKDEYDKHFKSNQQK